jgi:tRNA-splicing endonuclease subunit Sen15
MALTDSAPPAPAPIQSLIAHESSPKTHAPALHSLALQIKHNLQYQHNWTALHIHTHSPLMGALLPRPLISGLPAHRLYIHPDEQIELLKTADRARKAKKEAETGALEVKAEPEREWILPARLSEKWTLRRLAEVFDGVSQVPPEEDGKAGETSRWRETKRVVLATVDTDSTVVYYIVQDGVVKPRQN